MISGRKEKRNVGVKEGERLERRGEGKNEKEETRNKFPDAHTFRMTNHYIGVVIFAQCLDLDPDSRSQSRLSLSCILFLLCRLVKSAPDQQLV